MRWNGVPQRGQEAAGGRVAEDKGIELDQLSPCRQRQLVWVCTVIQA